MLLPQEQIGACKNRSTKTALKLLTKQIHIIQNKSGKHVASFLYLDIVGAFNKIPYQQLLHNLQIKKILGYLVNQIKSFLKDKKTTLMINWCKSSFYQMAYGIPQGSPISPILFLFFNTGLFNCCQAVEVNALSIKFVNNTNLLAYGSSTESTIKILSKLYNVCVQ